MNFEPTDVGCYDEKRRSDALLRFLIQHLAINFHVLPRNHCWMKSLPGCERRCRWAAGVPGQSTG